MHKNHEKELLEFKDRLSKEKEKAVADIVRKADKILEIYHTQTSMIRSEKQALVDAEKIYLKLKAVQEQKVKDLESSHVAIKEYYDALKALVQPIPRVVPKPIEPSKKHELSKEEQEALLLEQKAKELRARRR